MSLLFEKVCVFPMMIVITSEMIQQCAFIKSVTEIQTPVVLQAILKFQLWYLYLIKLYDTD